MSDMEGFRKALTDLINRYSLESLSDTPDFILADYLIDCLNTYGASVSKRESWYGRNPDMLATLGQTASFTLKRGTYNLHVYKTSDNDFTVDLDPTQELREDAQP